jgi:cardiolipin synthase (CMP-forming)
MRDDRSSAETLHGQEGDPLTTVLTVPNLVTGLRLLLIPVFFMLLLSDLPSIYAFVVFVIAASTDWVDGQIARRTNSVSTFGQKLDPFVDRFLIGCGVLGVFLVGKAPLWLFIVLVSRDLFLLLCGIILRKKVPTADLKVSYAGKITTALLLTGFASLLVNWPVVSGAGLLEVPFLPGLGDTPYALGIWFVYLGTVFSLVSASIYLRRGYVLLRDFKRSSRSVIFP